MVIDSTERRGPPSPALVGYYGDGELYVEHCDEVATADAALDRARALAHDEWAVVGTVWLRPLSWDEDAPLEDTEWDWAEKRDPAAREFWSLRWLSLLEQVDRPRIRSGHYTSRCPECDITKRWRLEAGDDSVLWRQTDRPTFAICAHTEAHFSAVDRASRNPSGRGSCKPVSAYSRGPLQWEDSPGEVLDEDELASAGIGDFSGTGDFLDD